MLSDIHAPEIKQGAAEMAAVLSDVLDAIKNSPAAYKQMVEEHKALKATKAAHQAILDDNVKVLNEHKDSRVKWSLEQQKTKIDHDKRLKEIADKERELSSRETAINVRDSALGKRDSLLKEKQASIETKEKAMILHEEKISSKEQAVKLREDAVSKNESALRNRHEKLKEAMG